jgi:hypothetical protein
VNQGEIARFQHAADFQSELANQRVALHLRGDTMSDPAREVIARFRDCPKFFGYEAGIDPQGHLFEKKSAALEEDRRRFKRTLAEFQANLAPRESRQNAQIGSIALLATVILGIIQVWTSAISMGPDALGVEFGRSVMAPTASAADSA